MFSRFYKETNEMSVPVLRAGFGLDFDSNDAIAANMLSVMICCFTEVFRSSYAVAHVYTAHQLRQQKERQEQREAGDETTGEAVAEEAVAEEEEEEREEAQIDSDLIKRRITLDHLVRGLHHQVMHRDGAVQQIKPLYAFIVTHRCMPDDATELVPLEWVQRILTHYDGARHCAQRARASDLFSQVLIETMMTGRSATEIVREQTESRDGSLSASKEDDDDEEDDDSVDDGSMDGSIGENCECEFCASVDACHAEWRAWLPADEFDEKIKDLVNRIERSLLDTVQEMILNE